MDDIVRQAIAKWPNVPHCFGWLALDARGSWRMRDERAQALDLPGDRIANAALIGFINRNYMHDDQGRWYFQNGPQRVYVNLEATPYIVRTDPAHGFVLHTGESLAHVDEAWLTDEGQLLLKDGEIIALLDDRDIGEAVALLRIADIPVSEEQLMAWLQRPDDTSLALTWGDRLIPVRHIARNAIAQQFGYVPAPQADGA